MARRVCLAMLLRRADSGFFCLDLWLAIVALSRRSFGATTKAPDNFIVLHVRSQLKIALLVDLQACVREFLMTTTMFQ